MPHQPWGLLHNKNGKSIFQSSFWLERRKKRDVINKETRPSQQHCLKVCHEWRDKGFNLLLLVIHLRSNFSTNISCQHWANQRGVQEGWLYCQHGSLRCHYYGSTRESPAINSRGPRKVRLILKIDVQQMEPIASHWLTAWKFFSNKQRGEPKRHQNPPKGTTKGGGEPLRAHPKEKEGLKGQKGAKKVGQNKPKTKHGGPQVKGVGAQP